MKKTVVELFAGVGGFHVGLSKAGDFDVIWANQWEPNKKIQHAFNCYKDHFGNETTCVNEDISTVKHLIPEHTLLVGGFPCQDYSVASTGAKGIKGIKGVLWWEIREIVETKRPPFILLENVDRLLKSPASQRGRDFAIMLASLDLLGYSVEWRVINAAEYGFAQRRRRVFIYAYRNDTQYAIDTHSIPEARMIKTKGLFATAFPIEADFTINQRLIKNLSLLDITKDFSFAFMNSGLMRYGVISTAKTIPVYQEPIPLSEILEKGTVDDQFFLRGNEEKWDYLKGSKRINRTSKDGHEYVFSEGQIAYPDPLDRPARTMLTSESSVNRSTHVILDPKTNQKRLLTPIECEKLNGFDPDWTNTGMPQKFRYFCMGNALVVGIVERLGKELSSIIDQEEVSSTVSKITKCE